MRPMRESDVEFARQQVTRNKTLLTAGAISQREVEQFEAQLRAAEAQLKALDEQIRQQRSQLNYYRVTAPIAGTVGDIPVNVGDRVTRTTVLTTVDENDVLEVYINVPGAAGAAVEARAAGAARRRSRPGARDQQDHVRLAERRHRDAVGAGEGAAGRRPRPVPIGSIRPRARRVDDRAGPDDSRDRGDRASTRSSSRSSRRRAARAWQAKQKPVQLGEIIGNDYVVQSGLAAGEQLIVSGLQKIRDGAPVMPAPPAAPALRHPQSPAGT